MTVNIIIIIILLLLLLLNEGWFMTADRIIRPNEEYKASRYGVRRPETKISHFKIKAYIKISGSKIKEMLNNKKNLLHNIRIYCTVIINRICAINLHKT